MSRESKVREGTGALPCPSCTRRAAIATVARGALVAAIGCSGSEATAPMPADDAVTILPDRIVIALTRLAALQSDGTSFVVGAAQVIVVRLGVAEYRAFRNICPHAGCGIARFADQRLQCQCHGSTFDTDGRNLEGPATEPLARLTVSLADAGQTLIIAR